MQRSFVNDVLGLDWIFVLKVLLLDLISNVVFLESIFKDLLVILFCELWAVAFLAGNFILGE